MINIFLSYRRGGDTGWSSLIEKTLNRKSDVDVFRDTVRMKPGEPFPKRLEVEIEKCDVVLALIGETWVRSVARLKEPNDWVRREILYAEKHHKLIIPVLLDDVSMPKAGDLPSELFFFSFLNSVTVGDTTSDPDIAKLLKFIRDQFRHYTDDRKWTTLNGLRGVINLALNLKTSVNADVIKQLGTLLVPEIFLDEVDTSRKFDTSIYREVQNRDRFLRIEGISYKTIELNSETKVQIGIDASTSSSVLVIYERLSKDRSSAKLITMFYPPKGTQSTPDLSNILKELKEPKSAATYRLPFKSLFIGRIISETALRHNYKPYDESGEIDSNVFVKLFDLEWIGSTEFDIDELKDFHRFIVNEYGDFTLIHATEWASKTSI